MWEQEMVNTVRQIVMAFVINMKKQKFHSIRGFTLIELVVVIGILTILAAGVIAVLNPLEQFKKAADSKRKNDLAQIQRALESYYGDHGKYPSSSSNKINSEELGEINWGDTWPPYMNVLPKDNNPKNYVYYASSDGQTYYLYTSLDRTKDPQVCNGGNACNSLSIIGISNASCGGTCNYAVSSPNTSP